jgi:hypothetical protein
MTRHPGAWLLWNWPGSPGLCNFHWIWDPILPQSQGPCKKDLSTMYRFGIRREGGEGGEGAEIGCLVPRSGKVLHSGSDPPQLAPCLRVLEQHSNK